MTFQNPSRFRQSDVVYVLAKLRIRGADFLLLNAHRKWGDWSLVGGHVEPTDPDWRSAAAREVEEEMAPLQHGADVTVEPLAGRPSTEWGPVPSVSAGGAPTCYRANWYVLRFLRDPRACLSKLSGEEFRLVGLQDVTSEPGVSAIVRQAADLLPGGLKAVPLAWEEDLKDVSLRSSSVSASPGCPRLA